MQEEDKQFFKNMFQQLDRKVEAKAEEQEMADIRKDYKEMKDQTNDILQSLQEGFWRSR